MNQSSENSLLEAKNSKNKFSVRESLFNRIERILLITFFVSGGTLFFLVLPYCLFIIVFDEDRDVSEKETLWCYLPMFIAWFCMAGLIILDCIKTLFLKRKI